MIKAVIFDKDGVLIDSEDAHIKSAEKAFKEIGVKLSPEETNWLVGRNHVDYLPPLSRKYKMSENDKVKFRLSAKNYYYEMLESAAIFHKTIDILKSMRALKIPVAICSSGSKENIRISLELMGLQDHFDVTTSKEDCSKRKPDPEPYLVTAKKLGVKPSDCLVFEDSEVGLQAALNAGMKCIVIHNKYTEKHDFTGAQMVVSSAEQIYIDDILKL